MKDGIFPFLSFLSYRSYRSHSRVSVVHLEREHKSSSEVGVDDDGETLRHTRRHAHSGQASASIEVRIVPGKSIVENEKERGEIFETLAYLSRDPSNPSKDCSNVVDQMEWIHVLVRSTKLQKRFRVSASSQRNSGCDLLYLNEN